MPVTPSESGESRLKVHEIIRASIVDLLRSVHCVEIIVAIGGCLHDSDFIRITEGYDRYVVVLSLAMKLGLESASNCRVHRHLHLREINNHMLMRFQPQYTFLNSVNNHFSSLVN